MIAVDTKFSSMLTAAIVPGMSVLRRASGIWLRVPRHGHFHGPASTSFSIVTHERIYSPPTTPSKAIDQIRAWLESPQLVLLSESVAYWDILSRLIERGRISGPRVHDGRIAALCIQHGVRELLSADRDFSRFGDLKTRNPLVTP